jgi:hypothetical protein
LLQVGICHVNDDYIGLFHWQGTQSCRYPAQACAFLALVRPTVCSGSGKGPTAR